MTVRTSVESLIETGVLPSLDITRWYPRDKAKVVRAVNGGNVTPEVVQELYEMTAAELADWIRREERGGENALALYPDRLN